MVLAYPQVKSRSQLRTLGRDRYLLSQMSSLSASVTFSLLLLFNFIVHSQQQSSISLNSAQWSVSNANGSLVLPASIPGGIYSDLRRNNILKQELLYGKNDLAYRWVGQENWTYATAFAIDHQIATSQSVKLVLHGLDTVATIYLNGEEVGSTDNMFVRYKFDIKPHLRLAGLKNVLAIKFESPIKYAARRSNLSVRQNRGKIIPPYCPSPAQRGECHVNFIRKMQASFSWDWGPAFPSVGIYKDIEIEFGSFGLIRDILVETRRLAPLVQPQRHPMMPTRVIISSNIRHTVQPAPTINKTVPYIRAPPYYLGSSGDLSAFEPTARIDTVDESKLQLVEENWLLKVTLVIEMAQPSFGYNLRVEFNLNGILHYESEHINVVANSDGYIRLGFNLRIDPARLKVKPWWPNNAGGQHLYRLRARVMPIPNAPDKIRLSADATSQSRRRSAHSAMLADEALQARAKPLQTPANPPVSLLLSSTEDAYNAQYVSEKEITFGFRTVELVQEPITRGNIEDGLTFGFRINGVDMFAMGSNWIPASILPENSNDIEHIRYLLQSAKDANMNMLRVWGGGLYESDEFYKLADEMGIMIWHDFMFACALYPVDDDFIASVRLEVEQQVQRLQYHPSIVLWAGNNENEMAIAGPWWPEVMVWNKKLREQYYKLYVETIKPIVQILDPTRPYIESSPSNGFFSESQSNAISRTPNDNKYGDVHHYDYLSDSFEWSNYPSTRFASEYGFQSYPSFNALTSVTTPSDWKYPLSSNILHRQHRLTGETEMKLQLRLHFNEPKSGGIEKFKTFIYLTQLSQAIAIKTETEFYRRNRFIDPETKLGKTMGALYWQLNDVWAAPTWSSIEYGGKWKMLHYFARRFFFPIQVVPYLVQPPPTSSSAAASLQQTLQQAGSSMLNRLTSGPSGSAVSTSIAQQLFQDNQQSSPASLGPSGGGGPLFVIDLVRDDMFDLLDSFNVTIRFYRWTSFNPVWQDTVYVVNTRPQNVTRIYEQDLMRIARHPGVISISSGVFQILIEQQPRQGLSQIENYLMPVYPSKVIAMRVAKINVELIQGPFELAEIGHRGAMGPLSSSPDSLDPFSDSSLSERHAASNTSYTSANGGNQWSCAYRLTLVSDSIAMFVWLDLNFLNSGTPPINQANQDGQQQSQASGGSGSHQQHLKLSNHQASQQSHLHKAEAQNDATHAHPPEHIHLQFEPEPYRLQERHSLDQDATFSPPENGQRLRGELANSPDGSMTDDPQEPAARRSSQMDPFGQQQQPPDRIIRDINTDRLLVKPGFSTAGYQLPESSQNRSPLQIAQINQQRRQNLPKFKPVDASGGSMLRYQFSDNAFNMFEPSKVVDLYLSRCLTRAQVEVALELQSLADSL